MSSYGYMNYYKPPSLAAAASKDPYGLAPNNRSGPLGIGSSTGFAAAAKPPAPPKPPAQAAAPTISPFDPRIAASIAANPYAAMSPGNLFTGNIAAPSAAAVNSYDLNTDPGLQQIQALVGQSNEGANAAALKQRQNLVLAYGDKGVAESVLGAGDPIAAAAAQNPTSTVAQLGQSRDRNLKTLTDELNADNLAYSGYRVTQEQQAGQDYQNALAQAAAGLNSNLDTVGSNLAAALSSNNSQLASGISAAADRAAQAAAASGTDPGAIVAAVNDTTPGDTGGGLAGGGAGQIGTGGRLPVGATNNAAIFQLLGRKTDPRYNF